MKKTKFTKNIKKNILKEIKKIRVDGLITISLIGSFQYKKELTNIEDIDLVIIVDKLTLKIFKQIDKQFKKISRLFTKDKIKVIIEKKRGPAKPKPLKNKKIIQLHLLIYNLESWKTLREPIILDANKFSKRLIGIPLKKIKNIRRLSKEAVLEDFKIHLSGIKQKSCLLAKYRIDKGKVIQDKKFFKISEKEYDEMNIFRIVVSFLNYLRFYNPNIKKNKEVLLKKGKKLLSPKFFLILRNSFLTKQRLRKDQNLTKKESKKLKKDSIEFIEYLYNKLK